MKRVLLTTFPEAFLNQGGGEREIHLLNEALNTSGIISEIYGPTSKPLSNYDAVIHLSMNGGSEHIISAISDINIPVILWPNLWFVDSPSEDNLIRLKYFLKSFNAVVFRSFAEEKHFRHYLGLDGKDVIRVHPLVSPKFLRKNISDVFRESYGLKSYAIWTGIIEPQKNQLAAVRAFNNLDLDLIISGGIRDKKYADECKRQAGPNIKFISAIPFGSEQHLSALRYSEMVVELPFDFPGTSAIEAAAIGSKLLLSKSEWTEEMLGSCSLQVDPKNEDEIKSAALQLLKEPANNLPKPQIDFLNMIDAVSPLVHYLQSM